MVLFFLHTKKSKLIGLILLQFSLLFSENRLPLIENMNPNDIFYSQYFQQVEYSYKQIAGGEKDIELQFYLYTVKESETLLTVAARCLIPYETIATINHISGNDQILCGKTIILPTCPGLFVPESPITAIESILKNKCFSNENVICYNINDEKFYFLQNERLTSTERAFFLDASMKSPLPNGVLSSGFGSRPSPFSGNPSFHKGVDLAAPTGTSVQACKTGIVYEVGFNITYGNYIILEHNDKKKSLYGHLSRVIVKKGDTVFTSEKIGEVGSTGSSTGPHLHFEIRIEGQAVDPGAIIKGMSW